MICIENSLHLVKLKVTNENNKHNSSYIGSSCSSYIPPLPEYQYLIIPDHLGSSSLHHFVMDEFLFLIGAL